MAKFPFYKQLDAMDCGPSSLRMIAKYYGKKLEFSQEMKGSAEVITEDLRLIERFLNPIRALVTKNTGDAFKK